jgi:tRNA(Ile)-lysidine synthase
MGQSFSAAISAFDPRLPLAIALSGGADSTALLVACARRWPAQVIAFHVHHGLQAAADRFEQHCVDLCESLQVPLHVAHVDAKHAPGESPEDAARNSRYAALQLLARQHSVHTIALAQHADDQVESVLLALSRGAGVAGLAGMRASWEREGVAHARPLLQVAGDDLRTWLRAEGIPWIEDPTNGDEQFTRNRIRARLLPAWQEAFPSFRDTIARSARHAADAREILEQVAGADLADLGIPPEIASLRALSRARQANVLRHWLLAMHGARASTAQMDELLGQLSACTTRGHGIRIRVGHGFVSRSGARLEFHPADPLAALQ